jgi:serine/threonine protein kinase
MTEAPKRFIVRTALPPNDPRVVRIARVEETVAREALTAGELVYVRGPRKIGKSTLLEWLAYSMTFHNACANRPRHIIVRPNIQAIAAQSPAQFSEILDQRLTIAFEALGQATGLRSEEIASIRGASTEPLTWFWSASAQVAALSRSAVVLLVDEIEEVLRYRNLGEQWLTALRAAHQEAQNNGNLFVCLFGRMPANLLVRSAERTPFNTAREITLPDFTMEQVQAMVGELPVKVDGVDHSPAIARAVYRVTGGQPNLTSCLLQEMRTEFNGNIEEMVYGHREYIQRFLKEDPECSPTKSTTYAGMDQAFSEPNGVWPVKEALAIYSQMLDIKATMDKRSEALPMLLHDPWSEGQRMLEAVGLAKIVQGVGTDDRYLIARNQVVTRIFDRDWVGKRLAALRGIPSGAAANTTASSEKLIEMERLAVEELCCSEWGLEHGVTIILGSGREVVENTLFQFELSRKHPDERLTLQLFDGVGDLGGLLWRRQVRTLRRLGNSGRSSALPVIYKGSLLAEGRVAYIVTHRPQFTLADAMSVDFFREHKSIALEQLRALVTGLDVLAEEAIVHRNISPGTIRFDLSDSETVRTLKFSNFEFAVMIRSIIIGGPGSDPKQIVEGRRRLLRRAFISQPQASWHYAPPEYLTGLFGDSSQPVALLASSDIYSLGMVAVSWFATVPSSTDFDGVIRQIGAEPEYDRERHAAFVREIQTRITRAGAERRIPRVLADTLSSMVAFDSRSRPSPHDVLTALRNHLRVLLEWSKGEARPMLACYSYRETAEQLMRNFQLITSPLHSEDNRRDVEEFLGRELRAPRLYYAPLGVAPFVDNPRDEHRRAVWVLVGVNWLFYCHRFERRTSGFSKRGLVVPHVLRIAYANPLYRTWRDVPEDAIAIEGRSLILVEQGSPELDEASESKYSRWDVFLDLLLQRRHPPSLEISFTALNWLVRAQQEQLELLRFPVVSSGGVKNGRRDYELDEDLYQRWIDSDPLRSAVYRTSNFRDQNDIFELTFQTAMAANSFYVRLRPRDGTNWFEARLDGRSAAGITLSGSQLPDAADVELKALRWTRRPIDEQALALRRLEADVALHDQLLAPHVVVRDRTVGIQHIASAVEDLVGASREIVRRIVETEPLMAVQGPPGTGKTAVISAVALALLELDETARILITAQSHAALDNVALRIDKQSRSESRDILRLRIAADQSFSEERVDPRLASWRSDKIANFRRDRIQAFCKEKLKSERDGITIKALTELRRAASESYVEIQERIEEGANLVFATTAGTHRVRQGKFLARGRFDIAIVDEASKAWPTEILLPLLMADRYLLVGDHKQLPAFGNTTVERVLQECISGRRDDFRVLATHQAAVHGWLSLFRSFFEPDNKKFIGDGNEFLKGWRDDRKATVVLDRQFRMRRGIAEVVSRAFYKGLLETDERVDARVRPAWIAEIFSNDMDVVQDVIWIDTTHDTLFRSSPYELSNLDQAELAAKIVKHVSSLLGSSDTKQKEGEHPAIVALSPYRSQNEAIETRLGVLGLANAQRIVHTVDSFQGQESDVVVLTLVRAPPPRTDTSSRHSALQRYGFLVSPERVNVMFSRARELLIIIGDYGFFEEAARAEKNFDPNSRIDLTFWQRACHEVARVGRIISYDDEFPRHLRID